jgi:hypothetical protein
MLRQKTLLVIGAGTSCEFDLPAGDGLRNRIADLANMRHGGGDDLIRDAISTWPDPQAGYAAAMRLVQGVRLAPSIDTFLDSHREDNELVRVGKLGIARAILGAERQSSLWQSGSGSFDFHSERSDRPAPFDTWLGRLFRILQPGVAAGAPELIFDNLTIANFNYDRCVEHFLFYALQDLFALPPTKAAQVMAKLDVIHPYGAVGALSWERRDTPKLAFGDDRLSWRDLEIAASGIRTFTEQKHDPDDVARMLGALVTADQIAFLGFGFHEQNMRLLTPTAPARASSVFATVFEQSGQDAEVSKREIVQTLAGQAAPHMKTERAISFSTLTAADFMQTHGRLLQGQAPPHVVAVAS